MRSTTGSGGDISRSHARNNQHKQPVSRTPMNDMVKVELIDSEIYPKQGELLAPIEFLKPQEKKGVKVAEVETTKKGKKRLPRIEIKYEGEEEEEYFNKKPPQEEEYFNKKPSPQQQAIDHAVLIKVEEGQEEESVSGSFGVTPHTKVNPSSKSVKKRKKEVPSSQEGPVPRAGKTPRAPEAQGGKEKKEKKTKTSARRPCGGAPPPPAAPSLLAVKKEEGEGRSPAWGKGGFRPPAPAAFAALHGALAEEYGRPRLRRQGESGSACGRKQTVVDACVAIILSQNTSNTNSRRALAALRAAYPGGPPQILQQASPEALAAVIKAGGLANVKSKRIFDMLTHLKETTGGLSLEYLRDEPDDVVKRELGKFKGLGPKSISCILAFTLDRQDLAVDTHVHRVANRLGLVVPGSSRESVYDQLGVTCPNELKQEMHVLLIKHGQQVCKAQKPGCDSCPLGDVCVSYMNTN